MAKSAQRLEARELRRKGLSVGEIRKIVGVGKGSVSIWCRDIKLTKNQTERLMQNSKDGAEKGRMVAAELKRNEQISRQKSYELMGFRKIGKISKRELFLIGATLYWAEGSKKDRRTTFVNSDSEMINLFIRWLKECLYIKSEDIYCHVSINEDHKKRIIAVEKYWSKITGISLSDFTKPSYKKVKNKKFYANFSHHYGTLFLKVKKGTNLNYEILGYIKGLKKNI